MAFTSLISAPAEDWRHVIAEEAAIPHARAVIMPGAGHMMMAERPDQLLAALREFA